MTDRELLELAAKAAGLALSSEWNYAAEGILIGTGAGDLTVWNPLTDDGDALRLAVKLGLSVDRTTNRCWSFAAGLAINGISEEYFGDDPYAATRRAIVRAAAEIGKAA